MASCEQCGKEPLPFGRRFCSTPCWSKFRKGKKRTEYSTNYHPCTSNSWRYVGSTRKSEKFYPTHKSYQGALYEFMFLARDITDLETRVVLRLECGDMWVIPTAYFDESVVDDSGKLVPRISSLTGFDYFNGK